MGGFLPCASSPQSRCGQGEFVGCVWQAEGTDERANKKQCPQRKREDPDGAGSHLCFLL